jgi:hypothetical protein
MAGALPIIIMKLSPFARFEAALESESPSRRGPKPSGDYAAITMPPEMKEGLKQLARNDLRTLAGYCRQIFRRHLAAKQAKPVGCPGGVGFYWWRPHDADPWQVLEVRRDGKALYVAHDDLFRYQCDDSEEHPWTGQWWPINLEPPRR